ncbi:MAG TPA: flagellar basal-body rod protein FlgF [Rhizomicrobium sp.]|jgi:flagellar basal-body rod protein FlgF|nr:flagellar basal-body rod protein FlgF [Rhizomicrobium sp.]
MDNSLLVSLSQQLAAYRAMDVIANNLANASTPGFKREAAKFEEYISHVRPAEDQKGPQTLSFVKDAGVMRDLGQGELTATGSPYDFAINGKGFFTVQTPSGMRYTRDGHFSLNQDGVLVTSDGYPVQGDGGAITVTPSDGQISVGPDGIISSILNGASNQIGKLQVVAFANDRAMVKQGANLYSTTQTATPVTDSTIAQNMLESSNVSPVIEISHMVEVMRAYQMIATMTNSEEELMRQAIDKLGSTPN